MIGLSGHPLSQVRASYCLVITGMTKYGFVVDSSVVVEEREPMTRSPKQIRDEQFLLELLLDLRLRNVSSCFSWVIIRGQGLLIPWGLVGRTDGF